VYCTAVFVLTFIGGPQATNAVGRLREEITGVLGEVAAMSERGDSVVLNLHSGGGTVTGYGLAAAQLVRLKVRHHFLPLRCMRPCHEISATDLQEANIPLVVCVDEVAASGGYLMAAVANRIIASPFAVLGSIGVVRSFENYSERLSREGISVEDITAGQYKRTLTPYKKPNNVDRLKVQQDMEMVLQLFKNFVGIHRPALDVDQVATGEVWFGSDALAKGLVDELGTSDEYILKQYRDGAQVYSVKLVPRKQNWWEDFDLSSSLEQLVHELVLGAVSPKHSLPSLLNPILFFNSQTSQYTKSQDSTYIPTALMLAMAQSTDKP